MVAYTFIGTIKDGATDIGTMSGTMTLTDVIIPPADTAKPVISSVVIAPSSAAPGTKRTITITASDNSGGTLGYTCKVGGADATPTSKPHEFTASPQSTSSVAGNVADASGNSASYSGTINVSTPPVQSSIPLSWNDPMFANNTNSNAVWLSNNGSVNQKSITDSGSIASIGCNENFTVTKTRINSWEGIRVGGSGTSVIDSCYIEVTGNASFGHADGIQCYANPPAVVDVTVKNTMIVNNPNGSATAGFFDADYTSGNFTFDNVVFKGGPCGLRINADGGKGKTYNVSLNKVYFIENSFEYSPFSISIPSGYGGAVLNITRWDEVRWARITNGQLVPGALIPKP